MTDSKIVQFKRILRNLYLACNISLKLLYGFQYETMIVQKVASFSTSAVRVIRKQSSESVSFAIAALETENGRRNGIAYERSGVKES